MLVGICADVPQSGKTSAAKTFIQAGWQHLSFGEPVKLTLACFLQAIGAKGQIADYLWGAKKGSIIPEIGITGGALMSSFATDYVRDMVNPDTWLGAMKKQIDGLPASVNVVIDDLRFVNEADWIKANGGYIIHIYRPDAPKHNRSIKSEGLLWDYPHDFRVINDGTLVDLDIKIGQILSRLH